MLFLSFSTVSDCVVILTPPGLTAPKDECLDNTKAKADLLKQKNKCTKVIDRIKVRVQRNIMTFCPRVLRRDLLETAAKRLV